MKNVWDWALAHWPAIVPVLLVILNDLRNGLAAYPKFDTALEVIGDLLSIHQRSDSPGTFKAPFKRSIKPALILQPEK